MAKLKWYWINRLSNSQKSIVRFGSGTRMVIDAWSKNYPPRTYEHRDKIEIDGMSIPLIEEGGNKTKNDSHKSDGGDHEYD